MFNFITKKTKEVLTSVAPGVNTSYPKDVQKVHTEFLTAADLLLNEAKAVLTKETMKDLEKGKRLNSLGFSKSTEGSKVKEVESKIEFSKEVIELVNKYKIQYPGYKFISKDQLESVCEKWGLLYGDVSRFTGFVPEKNLKEIERFTNKYDFSHMWVDSRGGNIYDMTGYSPYFHNNYSHFALSKYVKNAQISKDFNFRESVFQGTGDFRSPFFEGFYSDGIINSEYKSIDGRMSPCKLQICAPLKYMDTEGMRIINHKVVIDDDPIVLQPVKGGFLIVSMWADEQFDPSDEETFRNDSLNN